MSMPVPTPLTPTTAGPTESTTPMTASEQASRSRLSATICLLLPRSTGPKQSNPPNDHPPPIGRVAGHPWSTWPSDDRDIRLKGLLQAPGSIIGSRAMPLSVRGKIILPFAVVVVFVGVIGT